jgi:hypothetical protein
MARKPSNPKYRVVIEKSEELLDIAREIISEDFSSLKNASIEYVMKTRLNVGNDEVAPPVEKDQLNPGKASAMNPTDQAVRHLHFRIEVNGNWWEKAKAEQQKAMLDSLLCKCWWTDGKAKIVKEDFHGFVSNVRRFGCWSKSLQYFEDAMKQTTLALEASDD